MARYKVSFRVGNKTYYTEGDSTYPSDDAIKKNEIDMEMALESASVFASSLKRSLNLEGMIEPGSIKFEIYK